MTYEDESYTITNNVISNYKKNRIMILAFLTDQKSATVGYD